MREQMRVVRRSFAAVLWMGLGVSCGTGEPVRDVARGSTQETAVTASPRQGGMAPELRAAYVAAVQASAGEAYQAVRETSGAARFVNPAHGFGAVIDGRQVRLSPHDAGTWELSLVTTGVGCEGQLEAMPAGAVEMRGNRVEIMRGSVHEWYVNGPLGLEQGYMLTRSPACAGTKVVGLELGGSLVPELVDGDVKGRGEAIALRTEAGELVARYADLYVTDARGLRLSSWMQVEARRVTLHVDDAGAEYPLQVDPVVAVQKAKLQANDGALYDRFGEVVALSGDTALMGAPHDDDLGTDSGSAYVFVLSGGVWAQQAKLLPNDGAQGAYSHFGQGVAVSGDTAVVTTSLSAYVFVRSGGGWTQQAKLVPNDGAPAGNVVAVLGDTAIVGKSESFFGPSAAYVFVRSGSVWTEQAKLLPSGGAVGSEFGSSVALLGDVALVGAPYDNGNANGSGAAYVFVRSNGAWAQQTRLIASDGAANDAFGHSVALDGSTAVVGAWADDDWGTDSGSAYVFVQNFGAWTQQAKLLANDGTADANFGYSVALAGDTALVGAIRGYSGAGSAYVFERSGVAWTQEAKLHPLSGNDVFGYSVALGGDTALIGDWQQYGKGSAYVFAIQSGLGQGNTCATIAECASKFCVDGVCCDTACGGGAGDCLACSVVAGATVNGTCAPVAAGWVCRGPAGVCDAAEVCNGMNAACPADARHPAGTGCRASAGLCDLAEVCDGTNVACPADARRVAGASCRLSAGVCDVAEVCDGTNVVCPADVKVAAGTECRASAGVCDVAEVCDGTNVVCLADKKGAAGTECRASAGLCDVAEACNGTNAVCPADKKVAAGTECRASAGLCDVAEACNGTNVACPADVKVTAGMECRASAGACDAAEACDGTTVVCPADVKVVVGTECRATTGPCDLGESCNGNDVACPADAVADVTTNCRLAAGPCDIPEKCDGINKSCTPDILATVGSICRPAASACDAVETCNGISVKCPSDGTAPDGTTCSGGTCIGGTCANSGGSSATSSGSGSSSGATSSGSSGATSSGSGGAGGSDGTGTVGGSDGTGAVGGTGSAGGDGSIPNDSSGCSCAAVGASPSDPARVYLWVLSIGLLLMRRRRVEA